MGARTFAIAPASDRPDADAEIAGLLERFRASGAARLRRLGVDEKDIAVALRLVESMHLGNNCGGIRRDVVERR